MFGRKKKYPLEKKSSIPKYRLIITNDRTFEEKVSFSVSRMHAVVLFVSLGILAVFGAFLLIIYTPLKEYVPGHESAALLKEIYRLNRKADSLMTDINQKSLYIENIRRILSNRDTLAEFEESSESNINYDTVSLTSSKEDSLFRAEFENEQMFNLYFNEGKPVKSTGVKSVSIRDFVFFTPLKGIITSHFNLLSNHYGVDVVAESNEAIKATLPGTVLLADWTLETGNILVIQHPANIVSVYKHCSALLVKEGNVVNAGDPVAIAGQSGKQQTGPHLHFEIWYNGIPADPEKYVLFE